MMVHNHGIDPSCKECKRWEARLRDVEGELLDITDQANHQLRRAEISEDKLAHVEGERDSERAAAERLRKGLDGALAMSDRHEKTLAQAEQRVLAVEKEAAAIHQEYRDTITALKQRVAELASVLDALRLAFCALLNIPGGIAPYQDLLDRVQAALAPLQPAPRKLPYDLD